MLIDFVNGQAGAIIRILIRDASSSAGNGLTGAAFNTTGLIISTICDNEATATPYTAAASNVETITTLGTYAAPTAGKCRFKEVDATNHPGLFELQFANARLAVASAKEITVTILGTLNMAQTTFKVPLRAVNPYDGVRGGMSALPSSGTLAVNPTLNATQTFSNTGTWTGNLTGSVGSVTTVSDKTGYALSATGVALVAAETGVDLRQAIGMIYVGMYGKLSGALTSGPQTHYGRNVADSGNRASIVGDGVGNRTSVTVTLP